MHKIFFYPFARSEESPTSILRRMLMKHGCFNKRVTCKLLGGWCATQGLLCRDNKIIQNLADRAGILKERFLSGFYRRNENLKSPPIIINDIPIPNYLLRNRLYAFCSQCSIQGTEHFIKDLKLALNCPVHQRTYLFDCPKCQRHLHWDSFITHPTQCKCGHFIESPTCSPDEIRIELLLLEIFRSRNKLVFMELTKLLRITDYRYTEKSYTPSNRAILELCIAVTNKNHSEIVRQLNIILALHPHIPPRIICARISLLPTAVILEPVKVFLKQHARYVPTAEHANSPAFDITYNHVTAWLRIPPYQYETINTQILIGGREKPLNWTTAQFVSELTLRLKLCNRLTTKKIIPAEYCITRKAVRLELKLKVNHLERAISEKLLNPIFGANGKILFSRADIDNFSSRFISIAKLSSQSSFTETKIRSACRHLNLEQANLSYTKKTYVIIKAKDCKAIINWCKSSSKYTPKPSQRSPAPTPPYNNAISVTEAMQLSNLNRASILALTHHGHFGPAHKTARGYRLDRYAVESFRSEHLTTWEIARLLRQNTSIIRELLHSVGITPITGPGIDSNRYCLYRKSSVMSQVDMLRRPTTECEDELGYSSNKTAEILHIAGGCIPRLVKKGLLSTVDRNKFHKRLINKASIESFVNSTTRITTIANWLQFSIYETNIVLTRLGIKPIIEATNTSWTPIFSRSDITPLFEKDPFATDPGLGNNNLTAIVNIEILLSDYDMSQRQFSTLFFHSNFLDPIRLTRRIYLTPEDVNKARFILEKYLTYVQADKFLKHRLEAHRLTHLGILRLHRPLIGFTSYPMVDRAELASYLSDHSSNLVLA